jgi:hypothetical protein
MDPGFRRDDGKIGHASTEGKILAWEHGLPLSPMLFGLSWKLDVVHAAANILN